MIESNNTLAPFNNQPSPLVDQAALSADNAIRSTQRAANNALDGLAGTVQDVRRQVTPMINRATEQASALAQRGMDAVRDTSQQVRERAVRVGDGTVGYIRDEPVKSVLIAAAAGAAVVVLAGLLGNSRGRN